MDNTTNLEQKLKETLQTKDLLTDLFNMEYLIETAEEKVKNSNMNKFSLLLLDVDNMKVINGTYGLPKGDEVIAEVAKICKDYTRHSDIFARYKGGVFCCFLPNTESKDGGKIAENIRKEIEEFVFEGDKVPIKATVTIGVVGMKNYDQDLINILDCIEIAYKALREAKLTGNNKVIWY